MIPPRLRPVRSLAALLLFTFLAGCSGIPQPDGAIFGPFYTPKNVRAVAFFPPEIRRIAILPTSGDGPLLQESTLNALDAVLLTTLTQAARAELTPVSREDLHRLSGRRQLPVTAILPAGLDTRIHEATGADAVLFVDITAYSPYPPLILGLRSRLVNLKTGDLIWSFDNAFSAADSTVVNSARRHTRQPIRGNQAPTDLSYTVLQNPMRFADYVATATWATLPPR